MGNPIRSAIEKLSDATGYSDLTNVANAAHEREQRAAAQEAANPKKVDWAEGLENPSDKGTNAVPEVVDNDTMGGSAALAEHSQVPPATHEGLGGGGGGAVAVQNPLYIGKNVPLLGQENLDEADDAMKQGIAAAGRLGDVEAREAEAVSQSRQASQDRAADLYAQMQKDREEDRAAIAKRQKQLEDETDRYTADLADTGKFWRNPGNVIATIFASLSTMGGASAAQASASVDRMIQADWQQRKDLADTRLGALKSNLEGYRKLAGDKEAGDKLALAESYKMAEYDLERVASKLGSEKAKVKAEAIQQALRLKHAAVFMEAFEKMQVVTRLNAQDARTMEAAGVQTRGYMGQGPMGQGPAGQGPAGAAPAPSAPVGTGIGPGVAAPTVAAPKAAPVAPVAPVTAAAPAAATKTPTAADIANDGPRWEATPDGRNARFVLDEQALMRRIGPAQLARFPKSPAAKQAMVKFGMDADRAQWNSASQMAESETGKGTTLSKLNGATVKHYVELEKQAVADAKDAQKQLAPLSEHATGATTAKRTLAEIRAAFTSVGPDGKKKFNMEAANEVLKAGAGTTLAMDKLHAVNAILKTAGLKPVDAVQVNKWRADLFGGVTVFRKEVSGVAINKEENALLAQIIHVGADWNQFNGFVDSMYRKVADRVRSVAQPMTAMGRYLTALNVGSDQASMLIYGDK